MGVFAHADDRSTWIRSRSSWVIWGAVLVTVLVRLPLLDLPAWADEAGFLMVGGGWHLGGSGGHSLYGAYWVDRPPVLVTLYGLADRLGGLVALRLLGALAAALTVASVAWVAHSVARPRAAKWAAVTAAALLSTPFHWSFMVDGELLAVPFVAAGIGSVIAGVAADGRRGLLFSGVGGVMAAAAILTKQNIADVFVCLVAVVGLGLLARSMSLRMAFSHAGAFLGGVLGAGALVGVWTLAHGTSLGAVYYAMYPVPARRRGDDERHWDHLVGPSGDHGNGGTAQRPCRARGPGGVLRLRPRLGRQRHQLLAALPDPAGGSRRRTDRDPGRSRVVRPGLELCRSGDRPRRLGAAP